MNHAQLLAELEELTRQRGIQLRYEKGDFEGGYCVLKEQKILIVNKRLHEMRKAAVLAQALSDIGIDSVFIKPAVRTFIEDEMVKILKKKPRT